MAKLLWERGPFTGAFPWLRHSFIAQDFIDHHLVLHLLQSPFTAILPLVEAAKYSAAVFATLALFSFYLLLRKLEIHCPEAFLILLLASSHPFLYRMCMPRAQSLGVILFSVFLWAWFKGPRYSVFLLALVFSWSYQICFLLIPMVGLLMIPEVIEGRLRDSWKWLESIGGITLGQFANLYFPHNLRFLYLHVGIVSLNEANLRVGSEWKPYNSWFLLESSWPSFFAIFLVLTLFLLHRKAQFSKRSKGAFLLIFLFFVLMMKNRRWMEYWPLFSSFFTASALDDYWRIYPIKGSKRRIVLSGLFILPALLMLVHQGNETAKTMEKCSHWTRYRGAALWLKENSTSNSLVYTTDWDDFPELFFHNHENHYIVGLDPHFLYLHDADLYRLWERINKGLIFDPSLFIERSFGAELVFSDHRHRRFLKKARRDEGFIEAYRDDDCSVFQRVKERKSIDKAP